MFTALKNHFFGDLSYEEGKKFGILGGIFFFLIGSYWLLRTQKDAAFKVLVGMTWQPTAKMVSVVMVVCLALAYAKLVDMFKKHHLLMVLAAIYSAGFLGIAVLMGHPTIGFANTVAAPDRYFGWFIYLFIESFGSIMVGLFWAFVTTSSSSESAKKGFPLVIAGSQIGSILGSYLSFNSKFFGNELLFRCGAIGVGMIVPMVLFFLWSVPKELRSASAAAQSSKKPKTGMFEGLKILLTRPYVLGIFCLATLYEIVGTILDFQMKMLADGQFASKEAFASYQGLYGMYTNGLALAFALVGTSFLMRRFGLRFCLMLFPVATAIVVALVYAMPTLYVVTGALILIKGLSYALNNPAKEMMYIPTTRDVRYKAKGWIDMFGSRSSKGAGSAINNMFTGSVNELLLYGTLVSFGLIGIWLAVASYVGHRFKSLTDNDEVVS